MAMDLVSARACASHTSEPAPLSMHGQVRSNRASGRPTARETKTRIHQIAPLTFIHSSNTFFWKLFAVIPMTTTLDDFYHQVVLIVIDENKTV